MEEAEAEEAAEVEEEPALCSKSDACSRPDGHSGKCNSRRAVAAAAAAAAEAEAVAEEEEEAVELVAAAAETKSELCCKRCGKVFIYPKRLATHEATCDAEAALAPPMSPPARGSRLAAKTGSGALAEAAAAATAVLAASPSAAPTAPASEASGTSARKRKAAPPPDWGAIQSAAQAKMETEVPDEAWIRDKVNKAMANKYPAFDFATADYTVMKQQRRQFDSDIRAAYKSPLREAYEAAMTAVAAVAAMTNAPPPKKKAKKE